MSSDNSVRDRYWSKIGAPERLGVGEFLGCAELRVQSPDPARLARFYRDALGFVFDQVGDELECQLGMTTLRLGAVTAGSGMPSPQTLSFRVTDVERLVGRLAAAGVEVRRPSTVDYWSHCDALLWTLFEDPDGNRVLLTCENPDQPLESLSSFLAGLQPALGRVPAQERSRVQKAIDELDPRVQDNPQLIGPILRTLSWVDERQLLAYLRWLSDRPDG